MSSSEAPEIDRIRERLQALEEQFEHEMRARGFDPEQVDTVALTKPLAKLQNELFGLRDQLRTLTSEEPAKMNEVERIVDQLKRAFEGNAWHGPGVMEVLNGVTAQQAMVRPFPAAHTIWELALHIGAWERACLRRLNGERAELTDLEDWAPIPNTSDIAWQQLITALQLGNQELRNSVQRLDPRRLDEPIVSGMPSVYITVQGVVQHDLYHAGQIAILKKAITEA